MLSHFLLWNLQRVDTSSLQELEHLLAMIDDTLVRKSYQEAIGMLQQWNTRHLQQWLRFCEPWFWWRAACVPHRRAATRRKRPAAGEERTYLSKTAKSVLKTWFDNHLHHPYPNEEKKDLLGLKGGITIEQVNNWFINARSRKSKSMITRLTKEKAAGECKLYDRMVEHIQEPYRHAQTNHR